MSEQLDLFDQGPPRETPISTSSTHPAHSPIVVAKCLGAVNGAIINMVPGEQIIVADWQP